MRTLDQNTNDRIDTSLVSEVFSGRVDFLITEDRGIHAKATRLDIPTRVFTIDGFLEKVTAENPDLADYKVLAVRKEYFGNVQLKAQFFDSFRRDYPGFDEWFQRKADEIAYVCRSDDGTLLAFLYLKTELKDESYSDIVPAFDPRKRLKIGTLKVVANGHKLGERFLKVVFDNALQFQVDEIYVTIFRKTPDQERLVRLFEDWGFEYHGKKSSAGGEEAVYVRAFTPRADLDNPTLTYPYVSRAARKFIVPIYPKYHTELLPDSILRTESPLDFVENRPNRNAISKVYVCRSINRDLQSGDIVVFYRTGSGGPAYYTSVTTTIGVVQSVVTDIKDEQHFISLCRKRSVFTDKQLSEHWHYSANRPFVTNFLYVAPFPKRVNLKQLMEMGIIQKAPRGFEPLDNEAFDRLLGASHAEMRLVVD